MPLFQPAVNRKATRFSWMYCNSCRVVSLAPYTPSVKRSDFTVWGHTWRKNWVNCAVFTGYSAGLRTVLSSRLSHTGLRSSLRESHSFFSLPADTTMTSFQGKSVSSNSFSTWASHDKRWFKYDRDICGLFTQKSVPVIFEPPCIFLFKYHFLLHILRFIFFFSDNIMTEVAGKQQTTALFLSTTVTRTRRHKDLTKTMGNLCCARERSVQFFVQFFYTVKLRVYGALLLNTFEEGAGSVSFRPAHTRHFQTLT